MEQQTKWITRLLIISLLLNVYVLHSLNLTRGAVEGLRSQVNSRNDTYLSSQISVLGNRIDAIRNDAKWVTNIAERVVSESSTRDRIHIYIEWALREAKKQSSVYLYYKEATGGEWKHSPASRQGANFSAPLFVSPDHEYQYQIIEETSDGIKSSEIFFVSTSIYREMPIHIGGLSHSSDSRGKLLSMQLAIVQFPSPLDFYRINKLTAEYYADGQLVKKEALEHNTNNNEVQWILDIKPPAGYSEVMLEAEFGDGAIRRIQVWPNLDQFLMNKHLFRP